MPSSAPDFRRRLSALVVFAALAIWTVPGAPLAAAPAATLPQASPASAIQHVAVLSQQIGPRPTGSPTDVRASDYIAEQFRRYGYQVERQTFPILFYDEASPPVLTITAPQAATLRAITLIFSAATPPSGVEGELASAGLGTDEDFRRQQWQGKVALVQRGQLQFRTKVTNAATAGASAVIVYNNRPGPPQAGTLIELSRIPVVMISQEDGERLEQLLRAGAVRVRLLVTTIVERRTSQNVIGIKRGGRTPNEIVVVGGHADSVKQSPGANDNASGTAAVLEAARLLASVGTARTIHFIAFGAEEIGLIGSRFYVQNRAGTVVGMINMDMVGRGTLMVGNSNSDTSVVEVAERVATRLEMRVNRFRLGEGGSDHFSFEQAGIPTVFLHTGDDDAIHTPNDVFDRVSAQLVAQAASLAAGTALELANR